MWSFASNAYGLFQKHQPIQWTGCISHTTRWLTADLRTKVFSNPHFKSDVPTLSEESKEKSPSGKLLELKEESSIHRSVELKEESLSLVHVESKEEKTISKSNPLTVYCVHGTCDRGSAFHRLAGRIYQELPPEVSAIKLVTFEKRGYGLTIDELAIQLVEQITKNKDTHVFLMGHSRGGLVIEAALKLLQAAGVKVYGIVAIGTPYRGSWLAIKPVTWFSGSVNEMQVGSAFFKKNRFRCP